MKLGGQYTSTGNCFKNQININILNNYQIRFYFEQFYDLIRFYFEQFYDLIRFDNEQILRFIQI